MFEADTLLLLLLLDLERLAAKLLLLFVVMPFFD